MQGPVYLRSSNHRLPDLVADLKGQVDVELSARIDSAKGGRLRANFASIPDVPVEKFVMNLQGGKKGLLQNSRPLCGKPKKAKVDMTGQNGWSTHTQGPAAVLLRIEGKKQACEHAGECRRRGGAVSDGNSEERARDDGEADRTHRASLEAVAPRGARLGVRPAASP